MPESSVKLPVVSVDNVQVHFPVKQGLFNNVASHIKAVDGVSFELAGGEIFAVVGESGCGKTTIAHAILGLVKPTSGSIRIAAGKWKETGTTWSELTAAGKKELRRSVQVIFQDPYSSLNPRMTIRTILTEPLIIHSMGSKKERKERVDRLVRDVGLSSDYLDRYPHEFSGGQRQRVGIARALATNPELIIADEPVSALDVSIRAQILNLLQDLQQAYRLTMLFISHDLAVVRHIADRVAVMYLGRIVETGTREQIFDNPLHPYTLLLLDSIPVVGKGRKQKLLDSVDEREALEADGMCPFYPRCPKSISECATQPQSLKDCGNGHCVACIHYR